MIVAPMLDSAFMPVGALRFRIVCKFVDGAGSLWACLGISQIAFPYQRFISPGMILYTSGLNVRLTLL